MLDSDFAQLAAVLFLAVVVGAGAKFLKQPLIVSYILVGVIAGPAVLGVFESTEQIELLAKVGIAILLFLVGLKLDFHLIRSTGPVALATGVGQVIFTSVVGYFILLALGFDSIPALYIAVALTFSSTIIIVKLLSDKREIDELYGRIAVGFLIVQDILVIVAMIVIVAIGDADTTNTASGLAVTFGGGLVMLLVVGLLSRFVLPKVLEWFARSQELTLLLGVSWAIALAAVSASLGLSMEIGAFIAGVSLASTPYRDYLGARLVSLRDVLLLFFFLELGATLTFTDASSQIVPAVILSLFVLIGNPIIVMIIMGLMGYRKKVSFKAGLAVAQISEFSLILIALGYSLNQLNEQVVGLVTLVGVITITLSSYLIIYSDWIYDRLAPALSIFERKRPTKGAADSRESKPYDAIVIGAGRFGGAIISVLVEKGASLFVVDQDPRLLSAVASGDVDTLYGDVNEPELVAGLPLHETDTVICAVPTFSTNLMLVNELRGLGFSGQICVTALDNQAAQALEEHEGVNVMRPFQVAADSIAESLPMQIRP